ncbi:MAG: HEAT repeat domain-containing protein [Acidobacteriota bacterium]
MFRLLRWLDSTAARADRLDHIESTARRLAETTEPEALLRVLPLLAEAEPREVAAAAEAADRLLGLWPVERWTLLDARLRNAWSTVLSMQGTIPRSAQTSMINRLPPDGDARVAALVVMACHDNGHVRQRAVESFHDAPTARSLAALTLRLDDWVPEVRDGATTLWHAQVRRGPAEMVVDVLPLVHQRMSRRRTDRDHVETSLAAALSVDAGRRALLDRLEHGGPAVARAALRWCRTLEPPVDGWTAIASRHADASIRLQAVRHLVATAPRDELARRLGTLLDSPLTSIRWIGLDLAEGPQHDRLEQTARRLLFDRSRWIRRRCQEHLVLRFDVDPVEIARSALDGEALTVHRRAGALLTLSETAGPDIRTVVEAHLNHRSPRVRAAAVTALRSFVEPTEHPRFLRFLGDPSPRVVRSAAAALADTHLSLEQARSAYDRFDVAAARCVLLRERSMVPLWDRALFLLDAAKDSDDELRRIALSELQILGSKRPGGLPPVSPAQRRALERRLQAHDLPDVVERHLRFLLSCHDARA